MHSLLLKLALSFFVLWMIPMTGHGQDEEDVDSVDAKRFRMKFRLRGEPTIMLRYGITQASSKDMTKDFRRLGSAEIQLGYRRIDPGAEQYLAEYSWHGVSMSHYAEELWKSDPGSKDIATKAWQFKLGSEQGDGYRFGDQESRRASKTTIIPYRSSMYGWTRLNSDFFGVTSADSTVLALYDGSFRFGQTGGMGVQAQFLPVVAFDAAFKRGVVFSRHLLLKHLGSVVVEEVAHGLVSRFVDRIFESSPAAGPVVGFLLHSGITYGIYELRKERMHWPFATASPIEYDTYTFGVRLNL